MAAARDGELEVARAELQSALAVSAERQQQATALELALQRAEADGREVVDARAADQDAHRAAFAALERQCAELDDARGAALSRGVDADMAYQALAKDVETIASSFSSSSAIAVHAIATSTWTPCFPPHHPRPSIAPAHPRRGTCSKKGRPYRYPAGIAFTEVDDAAIRAFITLHAADQ